MGSAKIFEENVQRFRTDKWTSWRMHDAEQGETLSEIARHYRVTSCRDRGGKPSGVACGTLPAGLLLNDARAAVDG